MKTARIILVAIASFFAAFSLAAQARLPTRIGYEELARLLKSEKPPLLLDVRTLEEFEAGHIPGARLAPYDRLAASFSEPDKLRPIVVYCRSGRRSAIARETLASMGYADVSDFGAVSDWKGRLDTGPR